jgi:hypothetical protein
VADESSPDPAADGAEQPDDTMLSEAEQAIDEARRRLLEVPAEVVVTNHVMGLYELAAIHLSAREPNLPAATLAIDAVASLIDGLGDRLGEDTSTLRNALANIRMAYVQVKKAAATGTSSTGAGEPSVTGDGEPAEGSGDDSPAANDDALGAQ